MPMSSGCPLSGTLFALTFDPLIRLSATVTIASPRLCAFAMMFGWRSLGLLPSWALSCASPTCGQAPCS